MQLNTLETKIPPVFIALFFMLCMFGIAKITPTFANNSWHLALAVGVFLIGFGVALSGAITFKLLKTTVNPTKPDTASQLVTQGIFQVSRNPMYLGMVLAIIAWCIYLQAPIALLGVVGFVLYMNRFQIEPEERAMQKLFGEEFTEYCDSVRRWI